RRVAWWATGGAIVAVLGLVAAWFFLLGPGAPADGKSAGEGGEGGEAEQGKRFTQFHYSFVTPAGWVQTTDDSEARQIVVKSGNDTAGDDLIAVQEVELDYDGSKEWDRFEGELRTAIENEPADRYSDFDGDDRYAGKHVVSYTEHTSNATVEWYALTADSLEILVGCQYDDAEQQVSRACEQVVGSLEIRQ